MIIAISGNNFMMVTIFINAIPCLVPRILNNTIKLIKIKKEQNRNHVFKNTGDIIASESVIMLNTTHISKTTKNSLFHSTLVLVHVLKFHNHFQTDWPFQVILPCYFRQRRNFSKSVLRLAPFCFSKKQLLYIIGRIPGGSV